MSDINHSHDPIDLAPGDEDEPTFSPDDSKVAFVRENNLYVVDTATLRENALTSDGGARLLLLLAPWPGEGHYRGDPAGRSGVSAS